MKLLLKIFSLLLVGFCCFACTHIPGKKAEAPTNLNPKPLQEDISVYGSLKENPFADLLEVLYVDQVEKRPDLKKIEDDIRQGDENQLDSLKRINEYLRKSDAYYRSAMEHLSLLQDSSLKLKVKKLVAEDQQSYIKKTAHLTGLLAALNKEDQQLNDYHQVLKILVTLPLIARYHNNLPPDNELKHLITEKQLLIDRTKKLNPGIVPLN